MYKREGNYMSLDPIVAMNGVSPDMSRQQLIDVAYNARCGLARRLALVYLKDPILTEIFAKSDPDPVVRRRLVRELKDVDLLNEIYEKEWDASVKQSIRKRLEELEKK